MSEIQDVGHEVAEAKEVAQVVRCTYEGIDAMREAAEAYLPRNPRETQKAYVTRLARTDFFPAVQKAVSAYVGKPLGSPIMVDQVPGVVEGGLQNVDLAGQDFDTWARASLVCGLVDGITFAVADYPRVPEGATLALERELGARPYLVHVPLENVIDYRGEVVGGVHRLTHFRYKECVRVADGRWGTREVERIRVLEPGLVEVWEEQKSRDGKSTWVLVDAYAVTVPEVPVACFTPEREGWFEGKPPLKELAELNVRWWQTKSEQNHILHIARVPLLASDEDARLDTTAPVAIGVDGMIVGFKGLRYVEHSGAAIEAGRVDIQDTEARIREVAGQVLDDKVKTKGEAVLDSREGSSQLRAWVWNFQDYLEECLRLMALWVGEQQGGTVALDMEWDEATVGADVLTALSTMRSAGQISQETHLFNLQRAEILPPGTTVEEEAARLDSEAPTPMPIVKGA